MVDTKQPEQQSAYSSAQKHALATTVTQGKRERDEDMARQKEKIRLEEKERERVTQAKLREQLVSFVEKHDNHCSTSQPNVFRYPIDYSGGKRWSVARRHLLERLVQSAHKRGTFI